jgi:hypothetical protein
MKRFKSFPAMKPISICLLLVMVSAARATIPEPDNLIYGNITLDNALVTATRTDVVIEARRTTNGPAISSYRMGSNPDLGNFYSLRLTIESVAPVAETNASQVAESVYIVVSDGSGVRAEAPFTITERGAAQRIDFGVAAVDSDGDGLPDAWELKRYANLGQNPDSVGPNGLTALQNFIAGTDPNADGFRLHIDLTNGLKRVSFVALKAEGPGYDGMTRLYTLESNAAFANGSWDSVPDFVDVAGNNQTVNLVTAGTGDQSFFRGKIVLLGFSAPGVDSDGDGLPDTWENLHFGNLDQGATTMNLNDQTAIQNFVAGTDPNDPNSIFKLSISWSNNQPLVSFFALRAEGTGYEGQNRYYSLESSGNPATTSWQGVGNETNLLGNNQTVNFAAPTTGAKFYRARVWLQP